MNVRIAYSQKNNVNEIIDDLKNQLNGFDYNLVQFYSSSNLPIEELNQKLYKELGEVPTFGCTTCGELISGQMLENSIVLMAMSSKIVADTKIEILENISTSDKSIVDNAFVSFKEHFGEDLSTLDPMKHIGFVLIDGLSLKEEIINERIVDLTNITFVGGSAADDEKYKKTHVFANGKSYTDAAVLCLIKSNVKFDVLKTQSVKSLEKKLTVTKSDEATRTIFEFNNKPALDEYVKLVEIDKNNINKTFAHNPVGLKIGDDFFVRCPLKIEGNSIIFSCSVKQGTELELLKSQNIIEDTKKDLDNAIKEFGKVSAIVNFNCLLRTTEMKSKNQIEAYGELFKDIPTIGFTTYGESYIGHMNKTAIIVLFGE